MTESELRDLIATNIDNLEPGLVLLSKEKYIPNAIGTRSFIDLYAKDKLGQHVLIELKKTNDAARDTLHEIHKYVEGVKQYLGARDDEIRVLIASTEWKELRVPFSRFVADTKLAVSGLQLNIDEKTGSITAVPADIPPTSRGRLIAPWHEVNWYLDEESLNTGLDSIEACCESKGIKDFVIVVLKPPQPFHSEHEAAMRTAVKRMADLSGLGPGRTSDLPQYEYLAYFAMNALGEEQYIEILQADPEQLASVRELRSEMEEDEALQFLHEAATGSEPRPHSDHYEIGYPAKFIKFLDAGKYEVQQVRRYGVFERNSVLSDESILAELRGEFGYTGQKLKRKLRVSNRAHVESTRTDVGICLEQNPAWRNQILRALDEIQRDFADGEVQISIFNPATGVLTLFFPMTQENGLLYIPMYSLIVLNPEPVRIYFGGLQENGLSLTFAHLLKKYYQGDLWKLMFTMTWGGYESRDSEIIEDLGAAYRSFRCDIVDSERTYFTFRDDQWRPCDPVDIIELFQAYVEKNRKLVRQMIAKIKPRLVGGVFDASSVEPSLDEAADVERGKLHGRYFLGAPEECNLCGCPFAEEKYMIDGVIQNTDVWGCICADCFGFRGQGLGWGVGQLYLRQEEGWLQVAGFRPTDLEEI